MEEFCERMVGKFAFWEVVKQRTLQAEMHLLSETNYGPVWPNQIIVNGRATSRLVLVQHRNEQAIESLDIIQL